MQVPFESCRLVESVDCGLVLQPKQELQCQPELKEDCRDVAKEIPFIAQEKKCENVFYLECQQVTTTPPNR